MTPAVDEAVYARLRDGTTLHIRRMHRTDAGRLVHFHHSLSPATTRWRFFTFHPELSPKELQRFTHVDHRDREAIVALDVDDIIGVARWDRCTEPTAAEVAFVVTDAWQGRGVGYALFRELATRARRVGIDTFIAHVLADNRRMLAVFRKAGPGVKHRFDDGVIAVDIPLGAGLDAAR
jgi:RimJ/RimL family protein N-acetyltransferase